MDNPLYIRDIDTITHFSKNFIYFSLYFPKIGNNGKLVLVEIKKEIYLIKRFKTKMLVNNNILV